jgi:hypothetical protein
MSVLPESAELASHRDAAHGRRRGPGFGFGFWAMMAFAAACLIAAAIVAIVYGVFGGHGLAPKPAASAPPAMAATSAAPPPPAAFSPAPPPAATAASSSEQLATLEGRVGRLEAGEARALNAAAAALAAASLSQAAAGPRPFIDDLAAVERLMPGSPHVLALAPLASVGAPTRAELAAELADIGARVSIAAHTPVRHAGFMAQLGYAASRVVSIRRIDAVGAGPDAVLARAQRRAAEGDVEGALSMLDTLPGPARGELADWRQRAQRRVDIDSHVAALRALALADLAGVAGSAS